MKEEHRRTVGQRFVPWVLFLLFLLAFPGSGLAFNVVGPRAMGMGGAFVAVCDDATAVYWNPAALTQIKGIMDISLFGGVQATDHVSQDIRDLEKWFDDHNLDHLTGSDVEDLKDLKDILERFNRKEEGVFANGNVGLSLATKWAALSSVALADGNLASHADTEASHLITEHGRTHNGSRVDLGTLATNNIALTGATTLGIPNLALGVSGKYIQARRYSDTEYVFDRSNGEFDDDITKWKDRFLESKVDGWAWGIDAGALIVLEDMLKIGVLGRNINEPKIDWGDHEPKTKLRGEYRAGAALTLFKMLTISADADITKQSREVIETRSGKRFEFDESQEVSAGLEWYVLGRYLALRGGVNNITDSGEAGRLYTAGLGIRVPFVGLDLAAGYGGDHRYAASLGLNVRF